MNTELIKKKILDLAIRGKLVEQRPEEGTAEDLYNQIQEEKKNLIAEGKIKKEKPLPEITEDEIPFDIPESWKWVRLANIYELNMGQSPEGNSVSAEIDGMEFHQGKTFFGKIYLSDSKIKTSAPKKIAPANSIVLSVRAPVGDINITRREICIGRGLCSLSSIKYIDNKFSFCLLSCLQDAFKRKSSGTTFKAISVDDVKTQLVPLPPISEQKRIVDKVEEIFSRIDVIEKAKADLGKDGNLLEKKILDLAIRGKLVEQRPEEGTAEELYAQIQEEKKKLIADGKIKKEKSLPEITEEEIPFDIPESWKWVRFADIIDVRDGTHDSPKYYSNGIPLITSKNLNNGALSFDDIKYISEEDANIINQRSKVDNNDILFAMIGSIGNPVLVKKDRDFCIKNVALFKNNPCINMNWLYYFLLKEQYELRKNATGGVQSFISLKMFRTNLIPLPPLAEQKRIVKKIEELLPYCYKLKE